MWTGCKVFFPNKSNFLAVYYWNNTTILANFNKVIFSTPVIKLSSGHNKGRAEEHDQIKINLPLCGEQLGQLLCFGFSLHQWMCTTIKQMPHNHNLSQWIYNIS